MTKNRTERTVPDTVYRRHLLRAQNTGNYFIFRRDFITSGLFTPRQKLLALFLQDLINHATMPGTVRAEDDWFLCTVEYLESSLKWDPDTQTDYLNKLRDKGFIKWGRRGVPPARWVWIDVVKIEEALDEALDSRIPGVPGIRSSGTPGIQSQGVTPLNKGSTNVLPKGLEKTSSRPAAPPDRSHSSNPTLKKAPKESPPNKRMPVDEEKKEEATTPRAAKPTTPIGFIESLNGHAKDPAYKMAAHLADLLVKKGKAFARKIKLRSWAVEFRGLLQDDVPEDEIYETLDWYIRFIDRPYMVQAFCAAKFCSRFREIQAAIKREQESSKPRRSREPVNLLDPPPEYVDESEENYVPYDPEEDCIGEAD